MPGKMNPTQCEALTMVCAQVCESACVPVYMCLYVCACVARVHARTRVSVSELWLCKTLSLL
jgi:aspartate ammonia-lyase